MPHCARRPRAPPSARRLHAIDDNAQLDTSSGRPVGMVSFEPQSNLIDLGGPRHLWTLRMIRKHARITQAEVAAVLRSTQSWVSRLESTRHPDLLSVKQYGLAVGGEVRVFMHLPRSTTCVELDVLDWGRKEAATRESRRGGGSGGSGRRPALPR